MCHKIFHLEVQRKIVSSDRCRGEDVRLRTPALSETRQGSMKQIYWLLQPFFEKCGRSLTKLGTASSKTCDERQFLLGFVRSSHVSPRTVTGIRTFVPDSPHCLLIASSDPPRFASKSEEPMRRNRGSKEVPMRRRKVQEVQKVYKTAESVQKCRK